MMIQFTLVCLIIKFLSIEILTYLSARNQRSTNLSNISKQEDFKEQIENIESGGIYKKLGINNFLEGDFFGWYLFLWDDEIYTELRNLIEIFENYDCIVMESFGVGGIPESMQEVFYKEMEKWQKKGKIIVMATQVVNEGSNMEIYQVGQKIKKDFQLLEAYDMTLEATITKLMYLMAKYKGDYPGLKKEFYTTINNDILCAVQ